MGGVAEPRCHPPQPLVEGVLRSSSSVLIPSPWGIDLLPLGGRGWYSPAASQEPPKGLGRRTTGAGVGAGGGREEEAEAAAASPGERCDFY